MPQALDLGVSILLLLQALAVAILESAASFLGRVHVRSALSFRFRRFFGFAVLLSFLCACPAVLALEKKAVPGKNLLAAPANWLSQLQELGVRPDSGTKDYYELPAYQDWQKLDSRIMRAQGRSYLTELYSFTTSGEEEIAPWGGMTVLAVYSLSPKKSLVDAVNVQEDRQCGLYSQPGLLKLAVGEECLVVESSHLNAGEYFSLLALYGLRQGRIVRLDKDLPLLYSMRGSALAVETSGRFFSVPVKNSRKNNIVFEVIQKESHYKEEADKPFKIKTEKYSLPLRCRGNCYSIAPGDGQLARWKNSQKRLGIN